MRVSWSAGLVLGGCAAADAARVDLAEAGAGRPGVLVDMDLREWTVDEAIAVLPRLAAIAPEAILLGAPALALDDAGQDVIDHFALDPRVSDPESWALLLGEIHSLGMRAIIDLPVNHVSSACPWFLDALAGGPSRAAFRFSPSPGGDESWHAASEGAWYYARQGRDRPELDWNSRAARSVMDAAMERWLRDADGLRLLGVAGLVEEEDALTGSDSTHRVLAELHQAALAHGATWSITDPASSTTAANLAYLGSADRPESDLVTGAPRARAWDLAIASGTAAAVKAELSREGAEGARLAEDVAVTDVDSAARPAVLVAKMLSPGVPVLRAADVVEAERGSALAALLALRAESVAARAGATAVIDAPGEILSLRRELDGERLEVEINLSPAPVDAPLGVLEAWGCRVEIAGTARVPALPCMP